MPRSLDQQMPPELRPGLMFVGSNERSFAISDFDESDEDDAVSEDDQASEIETERLNILRAM